MSTLPVLHNASTYSFFFDFDGTLTEIAETPDAVIVEDRALVALKLLNDHSGAVAIVTGREIDAIDRLLTPLKFPVAGVHGFERRNGNKTLSAPAADQALASSVESILTAFVDKNPGLLLEKKRGALALHYRLRPELEEFCLTLMQELLGRRSDVVLTRGKMVVEIRLHTASKGTAIHDFLQEKPFKGRVPVFVGDDVTDEDGFTVVNSRDGISIKIGPGDTAAHFRAQNVDQFLTWLLALAQQQKDAE